MSAPTHSKMHPIREKIDHAFHRHTPPQYQKISELLNGLSMANMLDELWHINIMRRLEALAHFVPSAKNVNTDRLRAAIGVFQCPPPDDLNALIMRLPPKEQLVLKGANAVTHRPISLNPLHWSSYYSQVRLAPSYLPPPVFPKGSAGAKSEQTADGVEGDDEEHAALDLATALTANAPLGVNPVTHTVTGICRNCDAWRFGDKDSQVAIVHEPNLSIQISPDPQNPLAYQAAVTLINLHLKRHWGFIRPDVEVGVSALASEPSFGGLPSGGLQGQIEVHITTMISVTAGTSLMFGPPLKLGDPSDRGALHVGNQKLDMAFTPFTLGFLYHWDPPK